MSEFPELKQIIEGAILAADKPLSLDALVALFGEDGPDKQMISATLSEIDADCTDRGFELKQVASGYRFQVKARYGDWVSRLWEEKPPRYTRALLETLALIAYKQPITRGDIEDVRGVAVSTNIMRTLLEREWIRVVGHRDVPGRPAIYATTRTFLDYFNLTSLEELPTLAEIKDLDKVNEELDLSDEPIEARSLELNEEPDILDDSENEAELDQVTEKVNQIQENIRNLFRADAHEEEDLEALGDDELADFGDEHVSAAGLAEAAADVLQVTDPESGREAEQSAAASAGPEEAEAASEETEAADPPASEDAEERQAAADGDEGATTDDDAEPRS
ncbi:MAG: SMC-Scp complex subunit ScpB [Pseudomonadales bacterium]|nr:SMC-Scp complex subunit ScpB [Pseudomonadales bacterium]